MTHINQAEILPRLLDLKDTPLLGRRRWYWRYVHRWRRYLFQIWKSDGIREVDDSIIEQGVDDLLGLVFLLEYFHRSGCRDLPSISGIAEGQASTTAGAAGVLAKQIQNPVLAAVIDPNGYSVDLPIPICIFAERFEKRLADATWFAFRDGELPLSFFGEFHQLCAGNPLTTKALNASGLSTRQVRGIFYTPSPIVDYLTWTTLNRLHASRSPDELRHMRVLDPSCGCGAFLIACFRFLFGWHRQHFDDPSLADRHSINVMQQMFCGCDIDPHALRWTAKLLLLAAWECMKSGHDFRDDAFTADILDIKPSLECRSFLEPFHGEMTLLPEPTFDAIIGGPPFVRTEMLHQSQKDRLRGYRQHYLSAQKGQFDLYMLFIEQTLDLLKPGGFLAFSVSNTFLRSASGRHIRGYISANSSVEEIVAFDDPQVYPDASTQIALVRLQKTRPRSSGRFVQIMGRGQVRQKMNYLLSEYPHPDIAITPLDRKATASSRWRITDSEDGRWLDFIRSGGISLARFVSIEYGQSTGRDELLLLKKIGSESPGILRAINRKDKRTIRFEAAVMRSAIRGHQLKNYGKTNLANIFPFPFDARGKPLSEETLRKSFPLTYDYLTRHQKVLLARRRAKGCPWYSTFTQLPGSANAVERLMSPKITSGNRFRLMSDPLLVAHDSVVVITPVKNRIDPYFLLGVLNSKIFARYVALTMPKINVGRFSLRLLPLRRFPLPILESGDNAAAYGRIATMVREWHAQSADCLQGRILPDPIEAEIDRLYNNINSSE